MELATFRAMFPIFDKLEDDTINLWADVAESFLAKSWALNGKNYDIAMRLMTAHLLHLAVKNNEGNGVIGATQSATEGSVSVSFTAPTTSNGWQFWLSTTSYGLQLWALLRGLIAGGLYIGGLPERRAVRKVGGVFL